ncbi:MAG: hypothetical protein ACUZ8N_02025 [Candidatus Scalindua sp.]
MSTINLVSSTDSTYLYSASSDTAVTAVNELEAAINAEKAIDDIVVDALKDLQTMTDLGVVDADLADRAIALLEQTLVTKGLQTKTDNMAIALREQLSQISQTSSESTTDETTVQVDTTNILEDGFTAEYSDSSSTAATQTVDNLEAVLNANAADYADYNMAVKDALADLQTMTDIGAIDANLAARAITLLEQVAVTDGINNQIINHADDLKDQLVLSSKIQEFESLVNNLGNVDVNEETINNILSTLNSELNQAYADYIDGKIDKGQLSAALHTALDGATASILSIIEKAGEATGSTSKEYSIKEILKSLDAIINSLRRKSVGVEDDVQVEDDIQKMEEEETDPTRLAEELKEKVSDLEKTDFSAFTQKLRELGVNHSMVKKLFGEDGTMNSGVDININSVGNAGDDTGNFNATRFLSSISNGINKALDNYKEVKKTEEKQEAKAEAKEESKEAVNALA